MARTITYHLSLLSPWAYLGHDRFLKIAARHGATVDVRPFDILALFKETGGKPLPQRHPSVQAYRLTELRRWSGRLGIPLTLTPRHFPVPAGLASGMVLAAREDGADVGPLVGAVLRAVWAEDRDISDPATVAAIASEQGLDGAALLARAHSPEIADLFADVTARTIAAGVFGAPTYELNGELFWGQDRLFMLDERLAEG
ncbi:2-hydroxychromene-2-carboxylate isomerase [Novispirillum sp. DQ9]|uniref:2-hydroxychromene-2-carboxylate isomerase n=1 Tax=Novispirillum sp. DQ9 TaxID=3398612 RepID=UPI003C7D1037